MKNFILDKKNDIKPIVNDPEWEDVKDWQLHSNNPWLENPYMHDIYDELPYGQFDFLKDYNDKDSISWLIVYCEKARTEEMINYWLSLNPTYNEVVDLQRYYFDCVHLTKVYDYKFKLEEELEDVDDVPNIIFADTNLELNY